MKILLLNLLISFLQPTNNLVGVWDTNKDNTLIKIYEINDICFGEIVSSDNPNAKKGTVILKDLKFDSGKWIGKFYSIKMNRLYDIEIIANDHILTIKVDTGFINKTTEWKSIVKLNS